MNKTNHHILTLDIGGTNFRLALVDETGKILKHHKGQTHSEKGPEQAIRRIKSAATKMLADISPNPVRGMGVAIAGLVEPVTGVLLSSPNMLSWYNTPIKEILEREIQLPVWIGNDANLAVLGEYTFGAGRGYNDVIYLTISTGIGGGVITGGRLLVGSSGFGGELG